MKKIVIFLVVLFAVTTVMSAQNVIDVDFNTLINEIQNNKVRAGQLYHGKTIRTTGVIRRIENNFIQLGEAWVINVIFKSSERSKVINLNLGQRITIRGIYDGNQYAATINNAVIELPSATDNNAVIKPLRQTDAEYFKDMETVHNLTQTASLDNKNGNYDRAIELTTRAINLYPHMMIDQGGYRCGMPDTYIIRATAYYRKQDYDRAIADYTWVIENAPIIAPYHDRASAYMKKGNYRQARADVNRALQLYPNNQDVKIVNAELRRLGY